MADLTPEQFAQAVLHGLGIKPSPGNVKALVGWQKAEGGHWNNKARYNPLNTTMPAPGAGNTGSQGNIKVYRSWDQGVNATVKTLKNGLYGGIISALRSGNPGGVANAIGKSPWGTGGSLVAQTIGATAAPQLSKLPATSATAPARLGGPISAASAAAPASTDAMTPGGLTRPQILQQYLAQRGRPGALLGLAQGLGDLQSPAAPAAATADSSAGSVVGATGPMAKGVASFEGTKVAAWIEPALAYARKHGWQGKVNSGYRSFADQTRIYNSGVRPAARPGTSNHEGTDFPRGAVDVSNAPQLASILAKSPYAGKLQWAGAKDPVHFSHPHGGSY